MKCICKVFVGIGAFCFYYILLCSLCGCELDEPCKKVKNMVTSCNQKGCCCGHDQNNDQTESQGTSNQENQW